MEKKFYLVKKRTLILIAGIVWLIAGFNVARLGVLSYLKITPIKFYYPILSIIVFGLFGLMFYNMSKKHIKRIKEEKEAYRPFWTFFDLKSYLIMIFMMSGGIWLRASQLVPDTFIAFFYTGLGSALALAGLYFLNSLRNN